MIVEAVVDIQEGGGCVSASVDGLELINGLEGYLSNGLTSCCCSVYLD
jgi:hypothetical protein